MKNKLIFFIISIFFNVFTYAQNNVISVYLANGDSIYYCEGAKLNIKKIIGGKREDKTILKKIISLASENKSTVIFKPMTSFDAHGGAVGTEMYNICYEFKKNNIIVQMLESDTAEKQYFDGISFIEYLKSEKKQPEKNPVFAAPPMPPPPALADIEEDDLITFVLTNTNKIYYYKGFFKQKYLTTTFNEVGGIIAMFKKTRNKRNHFIIYKKTPLVTSKIVNEFVNKIKSSGVKFGHYGEFKLMNTEMRYLEN